MGMLTFKYDSNTIKLNNPAFLVGNGINYSKENNISWTDLLLKLFPENPNDDAIIKNINGKLKFDLDGLTYPEIAELAELYSNDFIDESEENQKISIKKRICQIIHKNDKKCIDRNNQESLFNLCYKNNIPILTTNFDHKLLFGYYNKTYQNYLEGPIEELYWIFNKNKIPKSKKQYPYTQLFNAYFKDHEFYNNNTDVRKEFAIWPIHGSKRYSSSICINNMDYAKMISSINSKLIKKEDMWKQSDEWEGKYTWLNIFLHNDLIILGLGLDSNEIDLRWLLVERFIYQKWINNHFPNEEKRKIIYLYSERNDSETGKIITLPKGTQCFFESLGIKCIKIKADDLYKLNYFD